MAAEVLLCCLLKQPDPLAAFKSILYVNYQAMCCLPMAVSLCQAPPLTCTFVSAPPTLPQGGQARQQASAEAQQRAGCLTSSAAGLAGMCCWRLWRAGRSWTPSCRYTAVALAWQYVCVVVAVAERRSRNPQSHLTCKRNTMSSAYLVASAGAL